MFTEWQATQESVNLPVVRKGKSTCLQNDKTPLSAMLPGSQNAFFSFFLTCAGESNRSILESSSDELILVPVKPGTKTEERNSFRIHTFYWLTYLPLYKHTHNIQLYIHTHTDRPPIHLFTYPCKYIHMLPIFLLTCLFKYTHWIVFPFTYLNTTHKHRHTLACLP